MSLSIAQFESLRPELLSERHQDVMNQIKELQDLEKYLYQNLQNIRGDETTQQQQQKLILNRIDQISNMRMTLLNSLKNQYSLKQNQLHSDRKALAGQTAVIGVMEHELERTKNNVERLKADKHNKLRMVEIGNYESLRYNSYINIMKYIVYASILLFGVYYLNGMGVVPRNVITLIIIIIISVCVLMISFQAFDISKRSNMDFDKYDWSFKLDPNMINNVDSKSFSGDPKNQSGAYGINFTTLGENIENMVGSMNGDLFITNPDIAQEGSGNLEPTNDIEDIETFSNYLGL